MVYENVNNCLIGDNKIALSQSSMITTKQKLNH